MPIDVQVTLLVFQLLGFNYGAKQSDLVLFISNSFKLQDVFKELIYGNHCFQQTLALRNVFLPVLYALRSNELKDYIMKILSHRQRFGVMTTAVVSGRKELSPLIDTGKL